MTSFGNLLSVARTALLTHQHAMTVASQNVSNAATEGYSRQRAEITASYAITTPEGVFGSGVRLAGVTRARDALLDAAYWRDASSAAGSAMSRDLLGAVGGVFNEPSENALGSALDAFWSSWGDLANAPTSAAAKSVVQQRAGQLSDGLRGMSTQLDNVEGDARTRLAQGVSDVNRYAQQIADLNQHIVDTEITGQAANDLRDSRDKLVDKLAELGPVRVIEASNGAATVLLGTTTLVDASNPRRLEVKDVGGTTVLALAGTDLPIPPVGGALGALSQTLNHDVPDTRAKLDAIAGALVDGVNAVYQRGYSAAAEAASPGTADWSNPDPTKRGSRAEFFDTTGADPRTARGITLSALIARDSTAIATGYVQNGTGDNSLALDVAALRDKAGVVNGQSIGAFYNDAVTAVATRANSADLDATAAGTLAQQSDTRRQSVSGVSTDEELVSLMKFQQAYTAATKLVKVADEMTQALLAMVG